MNDTPPKRHAVLIVSHPDGYLEVFAENNVDVHIAQVPATFSRDMEDTAEQVMEMLLPKRFQDLYWRDKMRANGTTTPLMPSALVMAQRVPDILACIKGLPKRIRIATKLARERRPA